ncbi:hypothetical protein JKP88DRAFT_255556 [Tribonema minus]|uniref:Uncharacterized protein n=1 Tax=Tribonema minus TaxID=303371 RepID=A0A835Z224_9STRA|nr:hypothetical protein JKP88DRAFT_255556 [Tribonema minus]
MCLRYYWWYATLLNLDIARYSCHQLLLRVPISIAIIIDHAQRHQTKCFMLFVVLWVLTGWICAVVGTGITYDDCEFQYSNNICEFKSAHFLDLIEGDYVNYLMMLILHGANDDSASDDECPSSSLSSS